MIRSTFTVRADCVESFRFALKERIGAKNILLDPLSFSSDLTYKVSAEFASRLQASRGDDILWALEVAAAW